MKKLLIGLLILSFPVAVFAGPFLASDPAPEKDKITRSRAELDGTWDEWVNVPGCTEKQVGCVWTDIDGVKNYLHKDLEGIIDGDHTARAQWGNVWGDGEITDPFVFTKKRPGKGSLRLIY